MADHNTAFADMLEAEKRGLAIALHTAASHREDHAQCVSEGFDRKAREYKQRADEQERRAERHAAHIAALESVSSLECLKTEVQFGVETNGEHVDTLYNGGFKHADDAVWAAGNGYRQGTKTRPVRRTIITSATPWEDIK